MNRYLALGCLGLGLMVSPLLSGQATSAVPAPRIGVIDIDNTLSSTPAGKRASDAFEKTRKTKQAELDKKQDELKKADADLQKQKAVLKPEQTYVKLERALAEERAKLIQDLLKQASPKIEALAKAEGVNIIVDREAVVWADKSVDLTAKLNAEMK